MITYKDMSVSDRWTWASALAGSNFIPEALRGNPSDIFFAAELAALVGKEPLTEILAWDSTEPPAEATGPQPPAEVTEKHESQGQLGELSPDYPQPDRFPADTLWEARDQFAALAAERGLAETQIADVVQWASGGRTMDVEDLTLEELVKVISSWLK